MKTAAASKQALMQTAQDSMTRLIADADYSDRQKLALTCRILFSKGHDAGLAGQITCRTDKKTTFITQKFGLGFDEISADNLLEVDQDLQPVDKNDPSMANPANRFHTWIYKQHPHVNCIIHTHPTHVAALSMLEVPLMISQMDTCSLYDDCAFLSNWPGVPVGNEEGILIADALADKRAVFSLTTVNWLPDAVSRKPAIWQFSSNGPHNCSCWRCQPGRFSPCRRNWLQKLTTGSPPKSVTR